MIGHLVKRLLHGVGMLIGISIFVFVMLRLVPGDVIQMQFAEIPGVTEERIAQMRAELGLDKSVVAQYGSWLGGAVTGDFGQSYQSGRDVLDIIFERVPRTMQVGAMAIVIGVVVGIPMGVIAAVRNGKLTDSIVRLLAVAGLSIPGFFLALLGLTLAASWLNWSPPLVYRSITENWSSNLQQTFPPAVALSAGLIASVARLTRSSMLDTLQSNYIRTVRAKGAGSLAIYGKHGLRNSVLAVFTLVGLQVGTILGGTVTLERIFGIPGLGSMMFEAVTYRDYPTVMAGVVVFGAMFTVVTIVVDLLYGVIDPRIRYG